MPKNALELAFSPEMLTILPFAIIIDLIGIILVCFGLDDFWITDIIAWTFIGSWSFFRSQVVPAADVEMPSFGEKRKLAKSAKQMQKVSQTTKKAQKATKAAKWAKRLKWFEFIPYVGALPLWSVSVYMTIKYS